MAKDSIDKSSSVVEEKPNTKKNSWLSFGKHSKFERQTLSFAICFVALIFSASMCLYHNYSVKKQEALTVTSAGKRVVFSRTKAQLTLDKMHWSKDRKTTYIPFSFDSIKNLSTDANDYRVFVKSAYGPLTYKPTGNLVLFGSTGRGVLIIHSAKKIPNEVLNVYIENRFRLRSADSNEQDYADISAVQGDKGFEEYFKKHDMLTFTVSPGATNIKKNSRVTSSVKTPVKLYTQLFDVGDVRDVKKSIAKDKKQIKLYTETANKLKGNLENAGYAITVQPKWMKENWKPYDYVNPKTGKYLNGQQVGSKISGTDPDDIIYPPSLTNKDGVSTSNTNADDAQIRKGSSSTTVSTGGKQANDWYMSYKVHGILLEKLNVIGL
ncbi:hypothetical protein [Ligilactobacillus equi]|uniref:hypothetical protein n=1 Tax=Ligilactobacillus equi TaxID=137357 RepID=UPI000468A38B|nr:hypothetical protein [Ligilactobacillus equi]